MTASRTLAPEELEAFGRELDAIRQEVVSDLGPRDVRHIRRVIRAVRAAELTGRVLLQVGIDPVSFAVGAAALSAAKILENMEVGHNVMHGQYDWTRDPELYGRSYEWDHVCTGDDWRHSHNYEHHTFTNILGKDRDLGYGMLRVDAAQTWHPAALAQPLGALLLAVLFQWGIGGYDLRIDEALAGKRRWRDVLARARPFLSKAAWQLARDYVFYPALAGPNAPRVVAGNLVANGARNVWTFVVIICGHFSDGVRVFHQDEVAHETRAGWYLRQLSGSANLEGGSLFHLFTGHLSHQIEHHLFPDLPASRYPEIAPRVRALCARHGQRYNTGSFARQLGSVVGRIVRHALPTRVAVQQ
jgi:linoleoyl-CoA desaturase